MRRSGFKTGDVLGRIRDEVTLRSMVPEDLGDLDPITSFQRRLGKALGKRLGRRYGDSGVHLVRVGTNQGGRGLGRSGRQRIAAPVSFVSLFY